MANQSRWQLWRGAADAVMADLNALPVSVGALGPSKRQMQKLAAALAAQGEGAGIAVDQAALMVRYAENTRKVLTAVQAAGGVTVLVQTGVTLATQQGLAACAKFAAKRAAGYVASGVAAAAGNYALDRLDIDPQTRQWMQLGLDLFQVFAFVKAGRSRAVPGSQCFVAGTRVVTAFGGEYADRPIEAVRENDWVLSRDQSDPAAPPRLRRVTATFARTADHLRVLTVRDAGGNVETLRTTDTHPFYVRGVGWTEAGELRPGQRLGEADGTDDATVVSTAREEHPDGVTVYNFEVEGDHTYFVEDGQGDKTAVWVHNACGDSEIIQSSGHILKRATSEKLVEKFGGHVKDWSKAIHALKFDQGIPANVHGKIRGDSMLLVEENGNWVEKGLLVDYLY